MHEENALTKITLHFKYMIMVRKRNEKVIVMNFDQ